MKFLFWNIKDNNIGQVLSQIVEDHEVDVVILAECKGKMGILSDLNAGVDNLFKLVDTGKARVTVYTRFSREFTQLEYHSNYFAIQRICLPRRKEILLTTIHFISKLHSDEDDQLSRVSRIAARIRQVEKGLGHSRTVLIGDLNMNPFEKGMISANGLHAVMTRDIAKQRERTVYEEPYPYFYNPMWGRFGDTTEGPPGTFYRRGSSFTEYFWNMYDQVLIRPDLLDSFDNASLKVLTEYRGKPLVRPSGTPDASRLSDHLPVLFALKM